MDILTYPNQILAKKASKLDFEGTDKMMIPSLVKEMRETMHKNEGLGLAAPQVGISKRFFIIELPETNDLLVFLNPELKPYGEKVYSTEGCLSLPGITAEIERFEKVHIEYYDINFNKQVADFDGLLAIAVQHENDHLDGILYIDHLSDKDRQTVLKDYKVEKE